MNTYMSDDFGSFSKLTSEGIFVRNADGDERKVFDLGDSRDKRNLSRPMCDRVVVTPDYIDCHYGGGLVRFEAQG